MSFQDVEAGKAAAGPRRGLGRQDSTQAVASGIFQINTAVSTFQRLVNALGTPKDTPELREKLLVFFLITRFSPFFYMSFIKGIGWTFGFVLIWELNWYMICDIKSFFIIIKEHN